MAKLESIEHKIFASEAPLDEIGQFGSALYTTKLNTKDVTTIQALPAYTKGWGSAIISGNNYPTMEEMNGVLNVMSYHTGYLYQEGMPAWRSDREYSATSIAKEPTGTRFFHSLKDGNIGNTLNNTEYWEELKFGGSGLELCDTDIVMRDDKKIFEQLKQMKRSTFDLSKFTVVGSPIISDDGVASGFSSSNYLKTSNVINFANANSWILEASFITPNSFTIDNSIYSGDISYNGVRHTINSTGKLSVAFSSVTTSYDIGVITGLQLLPNTRYYSRVVFNNNTYRLFYSTDGLNYLETGTPISSSLKVSSAIGKIGVDNNNNTPFLNLIDLKHFSITFDGKEVFSGNKTGIDVIKPDNYTVVGSPVISDDGVASGFSSSNYLTIPLIDSSKNFEIDICIKTGNSIPSTNAYIFGYVSGGYGDGLRWYSNGKLIWGIHDTNGRLHNVEFANFSVNTEYWIKLKHIDDKNYLCVSEDGVNYTENSVTSNSYKIANYFRIGVSGTSTPSDAWSGFIDLNSFKIYVDGDLVYQPCLKIPYAESKTGSKIVDEVYRDRVIDLYEQEGQAGYYTIDETNKNFTLPMGEIYGMIEQKGTYHPPLLSTMWSDHLLNDMSWLRADTLSWQDGNTYSLVYNELVNEYNNFVLNDLSEGGVSFVVTPKGYKIALADQGEAFNTKYATDGRAWFYLLDTVNKKFKLPATKFGFEGLRTAVGHDIEAGLPNVTGSLSLNNQAFGTFSANDVFSQDSTTYSNAAGNGGTRAVQRNISFDASRSSSIYGNSDTVQERATQMYLYFYVGGFTKSAESQTAGLKAELLNGKVDTSNTQWATNACIPDYSSGIGLSITSNKFTYTCPSNGMITIKLYCSLHTNAFVYVNGTPVLMSNSGQDSVATKISGSFIVGAGDVVSISGAMNFTDNYHYMYFYPMKGVN